MHYEGVCANAGPHSQKLHDRVTNICRNRMRQQSRSAMEPPQHEATSCQIDVVTSRQVSMLWPAVFHNNNSWNCLLLACSHTHIFKWTLPSSGFSQHPRGRVRGKPVAFKFKKNKFHFRTFSCLLTLEIIKFSQKKWQERVKNTPCYPGDPLIVFKNSINQQR